MINLLKRLFASKAGVTTVEYALITALIAVATIAGIGLVSSPLFDTYKAAAEASAVD